MGKARFGKSTGVALLLERNPTQGKTWIFDSERDPAYLALACANDFLVIDLANFKHNPPEPPPGSAPAEWFNALKRNLRESYFLRDGSIAMLNVLFDQCRRERGNQPIALRHLYEKIVALRFRLIKSGREYGYYDTLRNRFESLLVNPIFDCLKGFDLKFLTTQNVVFLCDSLADDEFVFLINNLLSWLRYFFTPTVEKTVRLNVVLEEVHRLVNPQRLKRADIAEPIILDAVRTLGKRGISFIFVDQVPSLLPVQLTANISFTAVFNTSEGRDLDALQRSFGLSYEQRVFLSHLPQRVCVVQYANPAFPEPFVVAMDDFPLRVPTDREVEARLRETLSKLSYTPLEKQNPPPEQAAANKPRKPMISKPALDYLAEITKNQFLPASTRDRGLVIPLGQGNALRTELATAGLILIELVDTHGPSKKIKNTRISDKGYTLLKQMSVRFERPRGKGGWEHRFHQHSITKWGKLNGYTASIEHFHDGKSVDVHLEKDGHCIAAEVVCEGLAKEVANVRDLHSGWDEIWFCVKDKETTKGIRRHIVAAFPGEADAIFARVQFKLLGDFQRDLKAQTQSEEAE